MSKNLKSNTFLNQKNFIHFSFGRSFPNKVQKLTRNQQGEMLKCCRAGDIFSRNFQGQKKDTGLQK